MLILKKEKMIMTTTFNMNKVIQKVKIELEDKKCKNNLMICLNQSK